MAASGAHVSFFFPMLGQLLPYYLNLALPAAFMTALVLLIARLDERLELETLLASGLSLGRIAAPLVAAGLVVAAASLVVGGFLEPHGRYGFRSLRIAAVNAGRIRDLQPKAFYRPVEGVALSVDAQDSDGASGLFLRQRTKAGEIDPAREPGPDRSARAPANRHSFGPGLIICIAGKTWRAPARRPTRACLSRFAACRQCLLGARLGPGRSHSHRLVAARRRVFVDPASKLDAAPPWLSARSLCP